MYILFVNATFHHPVIVQGHPGAGGEPGLPGLDACNGEKGQPGVPGSTGLKGVHGPPVTTIQMFQIQV